jgi:hypothetical protein
MMMLSMISFFVGAALGQRFKIMVLMPAILIVPGLSIVIGVTHAQSAWSIFLMAATAATSLQIGYLVGIGIPYVLTAAFSRRSSPLASHATTARHPAL